MRLSTYGLAVLLGCFSCAWEVALQPPVATPDNAEQVGGTAADGSTPEDGGVERSGSNSSSAILTGQCPEEGFATDLALSDNGDVLLVGAPTYSCAQRGLATDPIVVSGAAYVFARQLDGGYEMESILQPHYLYPDQQFGRAVALSGSGNVAWVSASEGPYAQVCVYDRGQQWKRLGCLSPPADLAVPFGTDLATGYNGERVLVTSPSHSTSQKAEVGRLFLVERNSGSLRIFADYLPAAPEPGQRTGLRVLLSGDERLGVVTSTNRVRRFAVSANALLMHAGPSATLPNSRFGADVAMSADASLAWVGEPGWSQPGKPAQLGAIHLYRTHSSQAWELVGSFEGPEDRPGSGFGTEVEQLQPGRSAVTLISASSPLAELMLLSTDGTQFSSVRRPVPGARMLTASGDGKVLAVGYEGYVQLTAVSSW